ncbi:hypothetical protein MHYP_G00244950 [Metynnis hypsauchen]
MDRQNNMIITEQGKKTGAQQSTDLRARSASNTIICCRKTPQTLNADQKEDNILHVLSSHLSSWNSFAMMYGFRSSSSKSLRVRAPQNTSELLAVPQKLWAKGKYDVGLKATAPPVVVQPKSDYRPKKVQYPLKPEAIAGITPVFQSLLEAGVIVPCPDSPVRTPIFPVKKIRGPGEPDEWRFVQDLQGVNAAIHPRAPEVPNPHIILSQLKQALASAPTLWLPVPSCSSTQTTSTQTSVLLKEHGGRMQPAVRGLPHRLRAVAAEKKAVLALRDITGYSDLTLLAPYTVSIILLEQKTSHLSAARWLCYHALSLELPNITVKLCTTLNPASLLPLPDDGEAHDCIAVISEVCSLKSDLSETTLSNADLELFVDGSASSYSSGTNRVGYTGQPIMHALLVKALLEAMLLPKMVAIVKCEGHSKENTAMLQQKQLHS